MSEQCACTIAVHTVTTIQRIAMYKDRQCSRKGRVRLLGRRSGSVVHMCRQHAAMALAGFVDGEGKVMGAASRAEYQRGLVGSLPPADWTSGNEQANADAAQIRARVAARARQHRWSQARRRRRH